MREDRLEEPRMHQVARTWSPWDRLPGHARSLGRRLWSRSGFSDEFGTLLRYEADMLLLRIRCAVSPGYRRTVRDLAGRRDLKIHLGCGANLKPGWINVDCYPPPAREGVETLVLEMRHGLPFSDGSASAIYSEHFLEHVSLDVARRSLIPECFRILAPGGALRFGVPDGEFYIRGYMSRATGERDPRYERYIGSSTPMMWINDVARSTGHRFLYDYDTLAHVFGGAGFDELRRGEANDSQLGAFAGADMTGEGREDFTVYIEARRPPS